VTTNTSKTVYVSGPAFPILGILGIVFITLKLTGVIDWAWLWVLAPFWIPFAIFFAILIIIAIVYGIWYLVTGRKDKKKRPVLR
jgi:hypothetical protein